MQFQAETSDSLDCEQVKHQQSKYRSVLNSLLSEHSLTDTLNKVLSLSNSQNLSHNYAFYISSLQNELEFIKCRMGEAVNRHNDSHNQVAVQKNRDSSPLRDFQGTETQNTQCTIFESHSIEEKLEQICTHTVTSDIRVPKITEDKSNFGLAFTESACNEVSRALSQVQSVRASIANVQKKIGAKKKNIKQIYLKKQHQKQYLGHLNDLKQLSQHIQASGAEFHALMEGINQLIHDRISETYPSAPIEISAEKMQRLILSSSKHFHELERLDQYHKNSPYTVGKIAIEKALIEVLLFRIAWKEKVSFASLEFERIVELIRQSLLFYLNDVQSLEIKRQSRSEAKHWIHVQPQNSEQRLNLKVKKLTYVISVINVQKYVGQQNHQKYWEMIENTFFKEVGSCYHVAFAEYKKVCSLMQICPEMIKINHSFHNQCLKNYLQCYETSISIISTLREKALQSIFSDVSCKQTEGSMQELSEMLFTVENKYHWVAEQIRHCNVSEADFPDPVSDLLESAIGNNLSVYVLYLVKWLKCQISDMISHGTISQVYAQLCQSKNSQLKQHLNQFLSEANILKCLFNHLFLCDLQMDQVQSSETNSRAQRFFFGRVFQSVQQTIENLRIINSSHKDPAFNTETPKTQKRLFSRSRKQHQLFPKLTCRNKQLIQAKIHQKLQIVYQEISSIKHEQKSNHMKALFGFEKTALESFRNHGEVNWASFQKQSMLLLSCAQRHRQKCYHNDRKTVYLFVDKMRAFFERLFENVAKDIPVPQAYHPLETEILLQESDAYIQYFSALYSEKCIIKSRDKEAIQQFREKAEILLEKMYKNCLRLVNFISGTQKWCITSFLKLTELSICIQGLNQAEKELTKASSQRQFKQKSYIEELLEIIDSSLEKSENN